MEGNTWSEKAASLDKKDVLKSFRNHFVNSDQSIIYLDGNSLGRLPLQTVEYLDHVIKEEWGTNLISSWNRTWYEKSAKLGNKIAQIIGAEDGEVIVSDNTSANLYKLAFAALSVQKGKETIITDEFNFPSDIYILEGLIKNFQGTFAIEFLRSNDGICISDNEVSAKINNDTALVSLSHVAFKSAFMYDMHKVTEVAHRYNAITLWDLSHSVGVVPIDVNRSKVDMAVGCTYKYLNGGPGAPAFLYVRKDLQDKLLSPIHGWFGADNPFEFNLHYQPASGIQRFLSGTPPILSLSSIEPGLDLILRGRLHRIRDKSTGLSKFFIEIFNQDLSELGFELASPADENFRGSHVSIKHKEAFRIIKALMDKSIDGKSIIPDFRSPDNIRLGFAPLYNSYEEVYLTIQKLRQIVSLKLYQNYNESRSAVT